MKHSSNTQRFMLATGLSMLVAGLVSRQFQLFGTGGHADFAIGFLMGCGLVLELAAVTHLRRR